MVEWIRLLVDDEALARALSDYALVAARLGPLTLIAPWWALRASPVLVRATVTLALTVAFGAVAGGALPVPSVPTTGLPLACLRESIVGTVFAVAASMPFWSLGWAGRLVDTWRGASLAEVLTPDGGERTSPLGDLYLMLGVVLFLAWGGHVLVLDAFADTLVAVPLGATSHAGSWPRVALGAAELVGSALAFAVSAAAPAAVAMVMTEMGIGLVARTAPQIPVFFMAMPLRAAVGLAIALLSASILVGEGVVWRAPVHAPVRVLSPLGSP
ncbi:MAG: flagellar biosynthetic protein FliR [Myxococcales bacterium]|nr:flagellar biosynthetic protein FliR [Myxococcales bacterium]